MSNVAASDAVAPIAADVLLDLIRRPPRARALARETRVESHATRATIDRVADIRPSSRVSPVEISRPRSRGPTREGAAPRVFIIHSRLLYTVF
jgi:hypothetical protein